MKKYWKTILISLAFALLLAFQLRDFIVINNMQGQLSNYYSSPNRLSQTSASASDLDDLNKRVYNMERAVNNMDKAVQTMWNYLNR
jgi:hypothetical protein